MNIAIGILGIFIYLTFKQKFYKHKIDYFFMYFNLIGGILNILAGIYLFYLNR